MIPPLLGVGFVLALLIVFMAVLSYAARSCNLHPEWIRKILHIGMGCVSLVFSWIFHETWPVILLATLAVVWLWSARRIAFLQRVFGAVLSHVRRESWGEIYFALSVALLFWLSRGEAVLFVVPVAILTFADATAALVGVRYGKRSLFNMDKTLEGSAAFCCVAFCITIIVFLLNASSWWSSLVAAITVAVVVTVAEAVSRDGFDNLSVPLVAFAILNIWS